MKKLFSVFQNHTLWFLIVFLTSNWIPAALYVAFGKSGMIIPLWMLFIASTSILALMLWWAKARFGVQAPYALAALLIASTMGVMNFGAVLLLWYGLSSMFDTTRGLPSTLFQTVAFGMYVMAVWDKIRLGGKPRPN